MPDPVPAFRVALINEETEHQISSQSFMLLFRHDNEITAVSQITGEPEIMAMFSALTKLWGQMAMAICEHQDDRVSGTTILALLDVLHRAPWLGHSSAAWHV